jgi:hypothetical protein
MVSSSRTHGRKKLPNEMKVLPGTHELSSGIPAVSRKASLAQLLL